MKKNWVELFSWKSRNNKKNPNHEVNAWLRRNGYGEDYQLIHVLDGVSEGDFFHIFRVIKREDNEVLILKSDGNCIWIPKSVIEGQLIKDDWARIILGWLIQEEPDNLNFSIDQVSINELLDQTPVIQQSIRLFVRESCRVEVAGIYQSSLDKFFIAKVYFESETDEYVICGIIKNKQVQMIKALENSRKNLDQVHCLMLGHMASFSFKWKDEY